MAKSTLSLVEVVYPELEILDPVAGVGSCRQCTVVVRDFAVRCVDERAGWKEQPQEELDRRKLVRTRLQVVKWEAVGLGWPWNSG
jgi:hypothetical protein